LNDDPGTARALNALGTALCLRDNFYKGRACFAESLELSRRASFRLGVADALAYLGFFGNDKSDPILFKYFQESLAICRELGDLANMSFVLRELGNLATWNGNFAAAQAWQTEALEALRQLDLPNPESFSIESIGRLAYHQGDYEKARVYFQECVSLNEQRGQYFHRTWMITRLGLIALWQGNLKEARSLFLESLESFQKIGTTDGIIFTLEGLAHLAAVEGKYAHAATLVAWADTMRQEIGDKRPPVEQAEIDRSLAPVCCQMNEQTLEQAQALGREMSLEEAVQFAVSDN
jgi:tetratricopeptide (TPR) repeat protein